MWTHPSCSRRATLIVVRHKGALFVDRAISRINLTNPSATALIAQHYPLTIACAIVRVCRGMFISSRCEGRVKEQGGGQLEASELAQPDA